MKKLSILIVDDEQLSIDFISNLVRWEDYGFELVSVAHDGREGLRKFKQYAPDVVITDVRMPVMNGVELAQEIRKISVSTRMLFLTAYDDFLFVRDALRTGASDYLLKEEMSDTVLVSKLLQMRDEYLSFEEQAVIIFEQQVAHILTDGEAELPSDANHELRRMFEKPYYCVIVEREKPLAELVRLSGFELENRTNDAELKAVCAYSNPGVSDIFIAKINNERHVLLYSINESVSQRRITEENTAILSHVQERLKRDLGCEFSLFAITEKHTVIEIRDIYIKYKENIKAAYFFEAAVIYDLTSDEIAVMNDKTERGIDNADLESSLRSNDLPAAREAIDAMTGKYIHSRDYAGMKHAIRSIVTLLDRTGKDLCDYRTGRSFTLFVEKDAVRWHCFADIIVWLKEKSEEIISIRSNNARARFSREVIDTIRYIQDNYGDSALSIDELAANACLSKTRLSSVFKEETGLTIVEYITDYRIERAKELLRNNVKIFEVATRTGYTTGQYFCRVFKRSQGISPVEYKKGAQDE